MNTVKKHVFHEVSNQWLLFFPLDPYLQGPSHFILLRKSHSHCLTLSTACNPSTVETKYLRAWICSLGECQLLKNISSECMSKTVALENSVVLFGVLLLIFLCK